MNKNKDHATARDVAVINNITMLSELAGQDGTLNIHMP